MVSEDLGNDALRRQAGRDTEERRVSKNDTARAAKHRREPAGTSKRLRIECNHRIEGAEAVPHTVPVGTCVVYADLVVPELAAHRLERVVRVDMAGGRTDTDRVAGFPRMRAARHRPDERERRKV